MRATTPRQEIEALLVTAVGVAAGSLIGWRAAGPDSRLACAWPITPLRWEPQRAVVARLLSVDIDFAEHAVIMTEQTAVLRDHWRGTSEGKVFSTMWQAQVLVFQQADIPGAARSNVQGITEHSLGHSPTYLWNILQWTVQ